VTECQRIPLSTTLTSFDPACFVELSTSTLTVFNDKLLWTPSDPTNNCREPA